MYNHILVALDGSQASRCAGQAATALAKAAGCRMTACHIYGAEYHRQRFSDMEPGLPSQYQNQRSLTYLRTTHDKLIHDGFHSLSSGYMQTFVAECLRSGINIEAASAEGRSYTGILQLAAALECDLIAIGADGLGAPGNGLLGGTTTRILHSCPCDVLVGRCPPESGPILTGIDGSDAALAAVDKAVSLGRIMKRPVHMAAVYDPEFHTHVFGVMAQALSAETQAQIGLEGQEQLHDDIINDGLRKLYNEFLQQAEHRFSDDHVQLTQSLLTGKPYCALNTAADELKSDLIVVGRHGHHRESYSRLGSNAECLIRTTAANVLLVGGVDEKPLESKAAVNIEKTAEPSSPLVWNADAQARLQRVPSFVRTMAKRAVENAVRQSGRQHVSADDFDAVAAKFGMGAGKGDK